MSAYLDGTDVLGAISMTDARRAVAQVATAPTPLYTPQARQAVATDAPTVTQQARQAVAQVVTAPSVAAQARQAVADVVDKVRLPTAAVAQVERALKSRVPMQAAKKGVQDAAKKVKDKDLAQRGRSMAARAAATARKLARRRPRAASKLAAIGKKLVEKTAVVGALSQSEMRRDLWFSVVSSIVDMGELVYNLDDLTEQVRTAGHVAVADAGKAIADRGQAYIENFDPNATVREASSEALAIRADADAWRSQAAAALASGPALSTPSGEPESEDASPSFSLPLMEEPIASAAEAPSDPLFASPSPSEAGVDWGEGGGGGGGEEDASAAAEEMVQETGAGAGGASGPSIEVDALDFSEAYGDASEEYGEPFEGFEEGFEGGFEEEGSFEGLEESSESSDAESAPEEERPTEDVVGVTVPDRFRWEWWIGLLLLAGGIAVASEVAK